LYLVLIIIFYIQTKLKNGNKTELFGLSYARIVPMKLKMITKLIVFLLAFQQVAVAVPTNFLSFDLNANIEQSTAFCHGHEANSATDASLSQTITFLECSELGCFCCIGNCHPTIGGQTYQIPERKIELAVDRYSFIVSKTPNTPLFRPPKTV